MNVLLCPLSDPGFLYSALAIGRELRKHEHDIQVLCRPRATAAVEQAELSVLLADSFGGERAFSVARAGIAGLEQFAAVLRAARETRADVIVTSILCHGALLAAERLDLPVVVLGLTVYLWPYRSGRNADPDSSLRGRLLQELLDHYHNVRELVGMPRRRDRRAEEPLIGSGLLLRGDPMLEQPGGALPANVTHIGPCAWEPTPDPAEVEHLAEMSRRVAKPTIYVHLGRTFGGDSMWPRLNATFTGGPFQAIVELGRSGTPQVAPDADVLVVRKPWMEPLVAMAQVVLTNGTSAPVLAALRNGRPIAVAPNGAEQPLLSRACLRAGVAVRFPDQVTPDAHAVLRAAHEDNRLLRQVGWLGSRLRGSGGAAAGAEVVLRTVSGRSSLVGTGRPGC